MGADSTKERPDAYPAELYGSDLAIDGGYDKDDFLVFGEDWGSTNRNEQSSKRALSRML